VRPPAGSALAVRSPDDRCSPGLDGPGRAWTGLDGPGRAWTGRRNERCKVPPRPRRSATGSADRRVSTARTRRRREVTIAGRAAARQTPEQARPGRRGAVWAQQALQPQGGGWGPRPDVGDCGAAMTTSAGSGGGRAGRTTHRRHRSTSNPDRRHVNGIWLQQRHRPPARFSRTSTPRASSPCASHFAATASSSTTTAPSPESAPSRSRSAPWPG